MRWIFSRRPFLRRNYTPLCVLGLARCGSNLLRSLLSNHPDILVHGESFSPSDDARNYAPRWPDRPAVPYTSGTYREYLKRHIFPHDAGRYKIVGFKLFPKHLLHAPEGRQEAKQLIRSIPGLKILLLVRENLLDMALSIEIAKRDNRWLYFSPKLPPEPELITLSPETLFWRMQDAQQQYVRAAEIAEGLDVMRITYNELTRDTDATMQRIQEWLGLEVLALEPHGPIRKQRRKSRRDQLTNFDELRAACADIRPDWLTYFDEPEQVVEVQQGASHIRQAILHNTDVTSDLHDPAFYMQLYHDGDLARRALEHLRAAYPHARVILQSDGDDDPGFRDLAREFQCEYFAGERLFPVENGGKLLQRMLNDFLSGPGTHLIRIDTDTRIDRPFHAMPTEDAVFGCILKAGPPQGGCVIMPRRIAEKLRDARIFLEPTLSEPEQSWGQEMRPSFLQERIESTGCIGFEWTLYWACKQLSIPILPHPEIAATWKEGNVNADKTYAVVHPDKFLDVNDQPVHDACTVSHAQASSVYLQAIYKAS